jgi:Nif-specific regulatory protein
MERTEIPGVGPEALFRLVIVNDHSVQTFPLRGNRWVIGRGSECDVRLRDAAVSRKHVLVERTGDAFVFSDLGSVNPVLLDGKLVRAGAWQVGQTLLVGVTRILLDRVQTGGTIESDPGDTIVVERLDFVPPPGAAAIQDLSLHLDPAQLSQLFECMGWVVADLGSEQDVAAPLLELALNVTGRRRGVLGYLLGTDGFERLAARDCTDPRRDVALPQRLQQEVRGAQEPFHASTTTRGERRECLLVPLGPGPTGVLMLEDPRKDAPAGQAVLRLVRAIGSLTWRRLLETRERALLRSEVASLSRRRALAHEGVLASNRLRQLRTRLRELDLDTPVLLLGEPGCEYVELARYAHSTGLRAAGPFVALHAANLSAEAALEQVFGGSGAPGAIERALSGTLVIEDADRLPADVQLRLANCLRKRALERSGQMLELDLRLVFASSQLPGAPGSSWRDELLDAAAPSRHDVPPLRTDARDVIILAELHLAELGNSTGSSAPSLSPRAARALTDYNWPDNVRELRAVLEQAAARAQYGEIAPRHLAGQIATPDDPGLESIPTLEQIEKDHILMVLERVGENRARAATVLGIAASTLYEKLKRFRTEEV